MVFNATTQKGLLLFLLALNLLSILVAFPIKTISVHIVLIAYLILCLFIQFKIKIVESSISFEIRIFSKLIYRKEICPNQIVGMKFKRVGWSKKCVVVQTSKGFNLRIVNFYPEKIYDDLIDYANEYDISILKTKDYLILEKLN
ncbi:hypothetical protein [Aquibacillus kalidii]|uniref:hypothetical protein n=1 Tax=Aquibacillus kalidii TaxID=2762597 RepID=UPI001646B382|nr:hypothetical protein [Aquibacillus kalidii]